MPGCVRVEMEDRLAIVTVERPDALNALNASVLRELSMAIDHLSMAADVGAIILTGAGDKAFVAGADIKEMVGLSALEMRAFSEMGRRLGDAMATCNKPIIAAVNGYALGGGCELALACDIRIASDRARLGQPEVNIGIIPGFGGSQRLPRIVGPGWAAELVYTGEMIDADTAERIGLVNRVVPADRLLAEAKAMARKIIEKSPAAIALAIGRIGLRDGRVRRRRLDARQGRGDAGVHRETKARVDRGLTQYDSNSSCKSMTTCSRTSSNDELRYSRIPPSSLWIRAMKLFELFRNSTFTRDSSMTTRSWRPMGARFHSGVSEVPI